jgi:hypothetical protein
MHDLDPAILHSMLQDRDRKIAQLERDLAASRAGEIRWEHEAKALRKELNAIRQGETTTLIRKRK